MSISKVSFLAAILLGLGLSTNVYAEVDCDDPKQADNPKCLDDGSADVIEPTDICADIATLIGSVVAQVSGDAGQAEQFNQECPPADLTQG